MNDHQRELAPCPFCGSKAEIITLQGETDDPSNGAQCVQCTSSACGAASGLIYPLMDNVTDLLTERWNTRALTQPQAQQAKTCHDSDCSVNNAPALPVGPCDCGFEAQQAAAVPAGFDWKKWRVVPVEPSTGMLIAGNHCQPGDYSAALVWKEMIEAVDRSSELSYLRPHLSDAIAAAPPAPVLPACPRIELVTALHDLASHFDNSLYAFGDDAEARRKARGDIAYALSIAAKHNQNGPGCKTPAPVLPQRPESVRVCIHVQGGKTESTEAQYMDDDVGYLAYVPREWQEAVVLPSNMSQVAPVLPLSADEIFKLAFTHASGGLEFNDDGLINFVRAVESRFGITEANSTKAVLPLSAWLPIESAPDDMTECVVVRWKDSDGEEQRCLDYKEDGCWMYWHENAEHVEIIGGHGVSYTPPYEHWMPLPPVPTAAITEPGAGGEG